MSELQDARLAAAAQMLLDAVVQRQNRISRIVRFCDLGNERNLVVRHLLEEIRLLLSLLGKFELTDEERAPILERLSAIGREAQCADTATIEWSSSLFQEIQHALAMPVFAQTFPNQYQGVLSFES